jgi:hypothetical protein
MAGLTRVCPWTRSRPRQRRAERFSTRMVDAAPLKEAPPVPETALTPWCVELRRLGRLAGGD